MYSSVLGRGWLLCSTKKRVNILPLMGGRNWSQKEVTIFAFPKFVFP